MNQTRAELAVLASLIREADLVYEVGTPVDSVLFSFVSVVATDSCAAVLQYIGERPDGFAAKAIAQARHPVVCLTGPLPADAFAWASLLSPGGACVVFGGSAARPLPWGRLSCRLEPIGLDAFVIYREATPTMPASLLIKRPRPRRPLRSVFLGDLHYCSAYRLGVAQGMFLEGGWHRDVNIRGDIYELNRAVREMRPDIIWTHTLLWAPPGSAQVYDLLDACTMWRRDGVAVIIHDGDPRERTRFAHDVSASVDLALLNHKRPVSEWNVPTLYWPYAALVQDQIGESRPEFRADLAFAGLLRDGGLYGPRTQFVQALQAQAGMRVYSPEDGFNNRFQIPDVAVSCIAMLGCGRPEVPGWIDTRVFSVPGAGGVLIHDDVGDSGLEPGIHYLPCKRYDVESVVSAFKRVRDDEVLRARIQNAGFEYVQAHHTWRHRVCTVLEALFKERA